MYFVLLGIAILLSVSMLLNLVTLKAEEEKYPPPGKLIEIDGHRMHIYGAGSGQPTIVMTCGSGTPSAYTDYYTILKRISQVTRTCVYERPGYGWSEHASTKRDTEQIVSDLNRLLKEAGEKPPFVFVAHSMGAMEALLYTQKYPEEVFGVVLIDGTSPYKHIRFPDSSIPLAGIYAFRTLNAMGLIRAAAELKLIPLLNKRLDGMAKEVRATDKYMIFKNILNDMVIKEGERLKKTSEEMNGRLNFQNMPMIVFAVERSLQKLPGWKASQESLLKMSANSRMIILQRSSHITVLQENADEITAVIEELILKLRLKADIRLVR